MDKNRFNDLYTQFNKIQNQFSAVRRNLVDMTCEESVYAAEMQVLVLVKQHPGYTVSKIAAALYITNSGASQLVKKLCKKGYLIKVRNVDNEREINMHLTESGESVVGAFMSHESRTMGNIIAQFERLDDQQMDTIQMFLDALEDMFDKKLEG